jgi:hypothetical protein
MAVARHPLARVAPPAPAIISASRAQPACAAGNLGEALASWSASRRRAGGRVNLSSRFLRAREASCARAVGATDDDASPVRRGPSILIAPAAARMRVRRIHTLALSLDGVLRYVPIAALHDGMRYLVEELSGRHGCCG